MVPNFTFALYQTLLMMLLVQLACETDEVYDQNM